MTSKEVTDREKSARDVIQAGKTHGEAAATALEARLQSHLAKGEHMPDAALLMRLMGQNLSATCATLVKADAAHEKELGDDAAPREARDTNAAKVYKIAVEQRDLIAAVHADGALKKLGVEGATPDDPSVLATWSNNLVSGLRDKEIALPAPRRRMVRVDREALADELDAAVAPLNTALVDVAREKREAEATQAAKNAAMDAHDAAFAETAGMYTSFFRAAGMTDIADKVKPSRRRPGRTASSDPSETPGDPSGKPQ